jgi:hypothetical protein
VRNQGAVLSPALRVGRFFVGSSGVVDRWWRPAWCPPRLQLANLAINVKLCKKHCGYYG